MPRCQNRRLYVSLYKRVLNSPGTKELKATDKEVLEVRQHARLQSHAPFSCTHSASQGLHLYCIGIAPQLTLANALFHNDFA